MRPVLTRLRRLAGALAVLLLLLIGAFEVLQTSWGREWLSGVIAEAASAPGFSLTIAGLDGTIPFTMRAERIEVGDERGVWLVLQRADITLSATALFAGRVDIRNLTVAAIEVQRPPQATAPAGPAESIFERLRLPSLPVDVAVQRFAVERLALGAGVLGEPVEATLAGAAVLSGESARLILDLHRTDGQPGRIDLRAGLSGTPPVLGVRLTAEEPGGLLLARLLHRDDRPPLVASFAGEGPLAQWHGKLEASAGSLARVDFDVLLAGGRDTVVTIGGVAAVAQLLPQGVATAVGDRVPLHLRASFAASGAVSLDALSVETAAATLIGMAAFGGPDRSLRAEAHANSPDLAPLAGLVGLPVEGAARLSATVSGSEVRPALAIDASANAVRLGASGAQHAEARLTASLNDNRDNPKSQIEMAAQGRVQGVIIPDDLGVPSDLGRDIDWSLAANAALDGSTVAVSRLGAQGAGLDIAGSGRLAPASGVGNGNLHVAVADLRPLSAALGHRVDGTLALDAALSQQAGGQPSVTLNGALARLRTGIPAADALLGQAVSIAAAAGRDAGNLWVVDRLAISGTGASVSGSGRFDPATQQLAATIEAEVPSLQPLSAAIGGAIAGRVTGRLSADGTLDHLQATVQIDGSDLGAGSAKLDHLRLKAEMPDSAVAKGMLDGDFRRGDLAGTLRLDADAGNRDALLVPRFRLAAADGVVDGSFRIDRATLLTRGTLSGRVPDLTRWSRLTGISLGGAIAFKAALEGGAGQNLDMTLTGDRLSWSTGAARLGLGRLAASARLTDLLGTPAGKAQATVTGLTIPSGSLDQANLSLASTQPGRFTFTADAKGRFVDPVSLAIGGEYAPGPRRAGTELRIARLAGSFGKDRFSLTAPLTLAQRGDDLSLSNLALALGSGQITGNAELRGTALSARLAARNLPVAPVARLAGYPGAGGTVTLDANLAGTTAAPRGHATLSGRGLSVALPNQRLPSLAVDATGDWNGRELDVKGRLGGLKGEALSFSGTMPVVLTARPLSITMPASGRLALRLQGAGDLANIADLLPLGEDRLAGPFTFDAGVTGSLAAPAATGHLTIAGGRYESFATGAVLTNLEVDLAGDRDRFTVRKLTAADTAGGTFSARGSIVLGGSAGPSADVVATLTSFRVASRDEAVVTASGEVTVGGSLAAPKVSGRVTVDRADCRIPDSLPPSVTRLAVVHRNRAGDKARPVSPRHDAPALPASLDIRIALPGRVFVRGHGLD
ncbi:MAG TPA: translocation/assembly module TamB domain-containing protein, partial [Stellaceae bacterium]|nr:translocation/assembly module TamB domain-containing protein [Stellaceae bacterium]